MLSTTCVFRTSYSRIKPKAAREGGFVLLNFVYRQLAIVQVLTHKIKYSKDKVLRLSNDFFRLWGMNTDILN